MVVTAIEVMGFGPSSAGVHAFAKSGSLLGDLGHSYIAVWVGDLVRPGAAISAFGCCLACLVGASRLVFAMCRDLTAARAASRTSASHGHARRAAASVLGLMAAIIVVSSSRRCGADVNERIRLVGHDRHADPAGGLRAHDRRRDPAGVRASTRYQVPHVEIVIPLAALVVLGYTLYRNVFPYPPGTV